MPNLIARAKANPNELNFASPGVGTTPHLSGELFKIVAGIQMTHVPFSGAGPAIQAILGGTTQLRSRRCRRRIRISSSAR